MNYQQRISLSLIIPLAAAVFLALVGTGCQATKGLGQDIENLGENIQGK